MYIYKRVGERVRHDSKGERAYIYIRMYAPIYIYIYTDSGERVRHDFKGERAYIYRYMHRYICIYRLGRESETRLEGLKGLGAREREGVSSSDEIARFDQQLEHHKKKSLVAAHVGRPHAVVSAFFPPPLLKALLRRHKGAIKAVVRNF
jgi:hypothetical protein